MKGNKFFFTSKTGDTNMNSADKILGFVLIVLIVECMIGIIGGVMNLL